MAAGWTCPKCKAAVSTIDGEDAAHIGGLCSKCRSAPMTEPYTLAKTELIAQSDVEARELVSVKPTPHMTDLERLARAVVAKCMGFPPPYAISDEEWSRCNQDCLVGDVRAILTELREPSEGMVKAAYDETNGVDSSWVIGAVIDHILEGK